MRKNDEFSRRNFIAGLGAAAGIGYSLAVKAEDLIATPLPSSSTDDIRAKLEVLTQETPVDARIAAEPNMHVIELDCDFLVAGGGMAGVCATLAAARQGARTILVQDRSRLGGNASSEVRMHIVGADHHGTRPGWREGGIIEELRLENVVRNPESNWEMWDFLLYDKVVSERNVHLLLDSVLYGVSMDSGRIQEVLVRCDKTEHIYRIRAKQFADCTGDCRLGLEAGAKIRVGHEARDVFNEPLAPEAGGTGTLGSSILFTSKEYDRPMPFTPPGWARKIEKRHLIHRKIRSWEYGYWWIEWGGNHSAVFDNERIRFELLSIVMGVWDYIKNSGEHPESASWAMDWVGMIPGKRASRRMDGPHILTQHDLMNMTAEFDDAAAIGGWPFDNHPPTGFDDPEIPPFVSISTADTYNMPLRAFYSVNVPNLFMAGRNISTSHVAFGSARVMATCSVAGQAVGTAAAFCVAEGIDPRGLYDDKRLLKTYQQMLLRNDQTIRNVRNEDPADLARTAATMASSEVAPSNAANVVNGYVRDLPGQWANRWGGQMDADGAWIELSWNAPRTISSVQITFDTGFERQLTLSEQNATKKTIKFGPQPETVKDYTISYMNGDGTFTTLAEVKGNYQRLRRHVFDPIRTKTIRIQVHATNGCEEARIFEIRCYA
ncbi:MAG: FAD-dependent oxidoreductase [Candidatus Hydrogenedentes bacterium]|nr:FAD-dependent oxidoreductase [Candidatus Hydrogenedentota bacterium]